MEPIAVTPRPLLLMVAAPREAAAVARAFAQDLPTAAPDNTWRAVPLTTHVHLVRTGVGKVNAAAAAARLATPVDYAAVLNLGVGGALPVTARPSAARDTGPCAIGSVVLASASVYADEGLITPEGFVSCAEMGFPPVPAVGEATDMAFAAAPALLTALRPLADHVAPIATVSTCSGTDAAAHAIAARGHAVAEAMEGAAIAHVCWRLWQAQLPFAELRVISNTTGDRTRQQWNLNAALERLTALATQISAATTEWPGV